MNRYISLLLLAVALPLWGGTGVAPAFFGPNALPVLDMTDGRTYSQLRVELAADGYFGKKDNRTADVFARVQVPLFTRWANLSVWMPVYEWYRQWDGTGSGAGDVYLSTDVQVLHNEWFRIPQAKYIPQMTVRLGMKTASGGQFGRLRHFDSPAYFFDASVGQSVYCGPVELRGAASVGFLCWQTVTAQQNDALMYGVTAQVKHTYASLQATWGGYYGWEEAGDAPMSLKVRAAGHIQGFEPYVQYQWGIKDYPYHQLRVGLVYNLSVLTKQSSKQ